MTTKAKVRKKCEPESVTLHHAVPVYIEDELCGVAAYQVDLTGLLTEGQAEELGRRIKTAQDRAVKKAVVEGADMLRLLDKPRR